jgi:hypothetical protein
MVPVSFVSFLSRAFISSWEIGSTFPFRGGRETKERNKKLSLLSCKHSCSAQQAETQQERGPGRGRAEERGLGVGLGLGVGSGEENSGMLRRRGPLVLPQSLGVWVWAEGGAQRGEREKGRSRIVEGIQAGRHGWQVTKIDMPLVERDIYQK